MTFEMYQPIVEAITGTLNPTALVTLLAGIFGSAIGFVVLWFVVKRVIKIIMGAVNSGRLSSGASGRRGR